MTEKDKQAQTNQQQEGDAVKTSSELVRRVDESDGGPKLQRFMSNFGKEAQGRMQEVGASLRQKMGQVAGDIGSDDGEVPQTLIKLRTTMDELNPNAVTNAWWFGWMPKRLKRHVVRRFVSKFQGSQGTIEAIINGLRAGKDTLLQENIELEEQYELVKEAQESVREMASMAEAAIEELKRRRSETDESAEPQTARKFDTAINALERRRRDLRTIEQANAQFFVSLEQTVQSNQLLIEQIESAIFVGPMVLGTALRIHQALARQRKHMEAVKDFQQGLGEMMTQNAQAIEQQTAEIGDMYNNPVISLEKMQESFDRLMNAVSTAEQTMKESTSRAREASTQLEEMTSKLEPVAEGMRGSRQEAEAMVGRTHEAELPANSDSSDRQ